MTDHTYTLRTAWHVHASFSNFSCCLRRFALASSHLSICLAVVLSMTLRGGRGRLPFRRTWTGMAALRHAICRTINMLYHIPKKHGAPRCLRLATLLLRLPPCAWRLTCNTFLAHTGVSCRAICHGGCAYSYSIFIHCILSPSLSFLRFLLLPLLPILHAHCVLTPYLPHCTTTRPLLLTVPAFISAGIRLLPISCVTMGRRADRSRALISNNLLWWYNTVRSSFHCLRAWSISSLLSPHLSTAAFSGKRHETRRGAFCCNLSATTSSSSLSQAPPLLASSLLLQQAFSSPSICAL